MDCVFKVNNILIVGQVIGPKNVSNGIKTTSRVLLNNGEANLNKDTGSHERGDYGILG